MMIFKGFMMVLCLSSHCKIVQIKKYNPNVVPTRTMFELYGFGASSRTRTYDTAVNSRVLYRLSY